MTFLLLATLLGADPTPPKVDYDRDVRPIFAASCLRCHGPEKQRGGLRLDLKRAAFEGGGDGPAILPGDAANSPVIVLTSGLDADRVMPPKGDRLTPAQIETLRTWINQGAPWPESTASAADPREWWSLRPLKSPPIPTLDPADASRARNPIDAFILAKVREHGLTPSPEADRRTLIRRLSFDLLGLPPSAVEIERFAADPSPLAYEALVERLLASPHFGERWARHWLDVVHFGETHGYDKDQPRPNAWPYRDYVIRAFNTDKPYGQFVAEQVAGDILAPGTVDGLTALGFIAAGPWDLIGHAEVPETKLDGKIARHLDRDDMVANTLNTFVSLTVQCAQCHNHKFDPIRQDDYYRLQAVFAALDRADRPFYTSPAAARQARESIARRATLRDRRRGLDAEIKSLGGPSLFEIDRKLDLASKPAAPRPEFGYHSAIEAAADRPKWLQVDLGRAVPIDRLIVWGAYDDFNNIGAGFGFPARFKVDLSDDPGFQSGVITLTDQTAADLANPGIAPCAYPVGGKTGRYLRLTATRLAPRQKDFILALAELEVLDATGANLAAGAPVSSADSIEAPPRWRRSNLTDGYAPGRGAAGTAELVTLREARHRLIEAAIGPAKSRELAEVNDALTRIDATLARQKPDGLVYAGTIHDGGALAFRGTGPDGGKPRPIFVLKRGDVKSPGVEVSPGAPNVLTDLPGDFPLSSDQPEGDRRAALARWLTDRRNALTWRSIVNRVWQYHFGRGLSATPNDFGRMGQAPSHPGLLDWLAADFRDNGQSLKRLHRLIVLSATYRQSSAIEARSNAIDTGNVFLWRMPRRKLEAEEVRDAVLKASGMLDLRFYGPSFHDFVVQHPEHSPHYEYALHDPDDPKVRRRSIYRFLVRSRPQPFMTALDCADPSMQVDRRNETLSPLQALALYNNGFMLVSARHLAERVKNDAEPVASAFRLAVGRVPTPAEREPLLDYANEFGLADACRVILNLNECLFVD